MAPMEIFESVWDRVVNSSWYDGDYISQKSPIIIGGCARSGTTLMRVMLDTHPSIYCGPECNIFTPVRIRTTKRMRDLSWIFDVPVPKIRSLLKESRCLSEFIEKFFNHLCGIHKKNRWGEKTPTNVLHLDYIFRHFPRAKFIHMIRDGRDVACSLKHFPKRKVVEGRVIPVETNNPLEKCINRWVHDVNVGRQWQGDPRYIEVKYEDLVTNTEEPLRRLFDFLGEPYHEQVLRYYEIEGASRDASKFPQNVEATKPIYKQAMGRWSNEFTEDDKRMFKRIGGDLLIQLGYEENEEW